MAEKMQKSNERPQEKNVGEPEHKRPKPNGCANPAADSMETKNITNICYDSLEHIFDFLDVISLLKVADTCKRLQIAAAVKFGDKHGEINIEIDVEAYETMVSVTPTRAHVNGLKLCLSLLRCFGAKISNLTLQYFFVCPELESNLDQYINQYCADALISIEICDKSHFLTMHTKNRLKMLKKWK